MSLALALHALAHPLCFSLSSSQLASTKVPGDFSTSPRWGTLLRASRKQVIRSHEGLQRATAGTGPAVHPLMPQARASARQSASALHT